MATWFDENNVSPLDEQPAATVPTHSLMDAYEQGLAGLNSDGTPVAPALPSLIPQYSGTSGVVNGLNQYEAQKPKELTEEGEAQFEEWRKGLGSVQKPQEDMPLVGLSDTWEAAKDFWSGLATTAPAAYYRLKEGDTRPDLYSPEAKAAFAAEDEHRKQNEIERAQRAKEGTATQFGQAIREAGDSSGFTVGSMAAALPAGVAMGAATQAAIPVPGSGVVGGIIGSFAGSGTAAYRMQQSMFLEEAFKAAEAQSEKKNKRAMTEAEKQEFYTAMKPLADDSALWEAGPEAVGNAFMLVGGGIATNLLGKGAMSRIAGGVMKKAGIRAGAAAMGAGMELATETTTQVAQAKDDAKREAYLAGKPMDEAVSIYDQPGGGGVYQAFKDVAAPTIGTMAMFGLAGGAVKGGSKAYERIVTNPQEAQAIVEMAQDNNVLSALPDASLQNLRSMGGWLNRQWFQGSERQDALNEAIGNINAELNNRQSESPEIKKARQDALREQWEAMQPAQQKGILQFLTNESPGMTGYLDDQGNAIADSEGNAIGEIDVKGLHRLAPVIGLKGQELQATKQRILGNSYDASPDAISQDIITDDQGNQWVRDPANGEWKPSNVPAGLSQVSPLNSSERLSAINQRRSEISQLLMGNPSKKDKRKLTRELSDLNVEAAHLKGVNAPSPLSDAQRQASRDAYRQRIGEIAAQVQAEQAAIAQSQQYSEQQKAILAREAEFRAQQQIEIEQRKLAEQERLAMGVPIGDPTVESARPTDRMVDQEGNPLQLGLSRLGFGEDQPLAIPGGDQPLGGPQAPVGPSPTPTDPKTIQLQRGESVELTPTDPNAALPRSVTTPEDEAKLRAFMGERPQRPEPPGLASIPRSPAPPPIQIGNQQVAPVAEGTLQGLDWLREQAKQIAQRNTPTDVATDLLAQIPGIQGERQRLEQEGLKPKAPASVQPQAPTDAAPQKDALLKSIQNRGAATQGDTSVLIESTPTNDGFIVRRTKGGQRDYPFKNPMSLEEAQVAARSLLDEVGQDTPKNKNKYIGNVDEDNWQNLLSEVKKSGNPADFARLGAAILDSGKNSRFSIGDRSLPWQQEASLAVIRASREITTPTPAESAIQPQPENQNDSRSQEGQTQATPLLDQGTQSAPEVGADTSSTEQAPTPIDYPSLNETELKNQDATLRQRIHEINTEIAARSNGITNEKIKTGIQNEYAKELKQLDHELGYVSEEIDRRRVDAEKKNPRPYQDTPTETLQADLEVMELEQVDRLKELPTKSGKAKEATQQRIDEYQARIDGFKKELEVRGALLKESPTSTEQPTPSKVTLPEKVTNQRADAVSYLRGRIGKDWENKFELVQDEQTNKWSVVEKGAIKVADSIKEDKKLTAREKLLRRISAEDRANEEESAREIAQTEKEAGEDIVVQAQKELDDVAQEYSEEDYIYFLKNFNSVKPAKLPNGGWTFVDRESITPTAPTETSVDVATENWWSKELTPEGRRQALKAAGFKAGMFQVTWKNLLDEVKKKLEGVRGTKNDPMMANAAPAPLVVKSIEQLESALKSGFVAILPNEMKLQIKEEKALGSSANENITEHVLYITHPSGTVETSRGTVLNPTTLEEALTEAKKKWPKEESTQQDQAPTLAQQNIAAFDTYEKELESLAVAMRDAGVNEGQIDKVLNTAMRRSNPKIGNVRIGTDMLQDALETSIKRIRATVEDAIDAAHRAKQTTENPNDPNADQSDSETTLAGNIPGSIPADEGAQRPGERSASDRNLDVEGDGRLGSNRNDDTGGVASEQGIVGVQKPAAGLDTTGDERDQRLNALWDRLDEESFGEAPAPKKAPRKKGDATTSTVKPKKTRKKSGAIKTNEAGNPATIADLAKDLGKEAVQAIDKSTTGLLNAFFGKGGRVNIGFNFDPDEYQRVKPLFLESAQHLRNVVADAAEIVRLIYQEVKRKAEASGLSKEEVREGLSYMRPYAIQFAKDVEDGVIVLEAAEVPENPTQAKGAALVGENPGNYRITDADQLGQGSDNVKVDQNIAAIRLVKQLEAENRYATREEQAALAKYVGWGGLKGAFAPKGDQQIKWNQKLKALVTEGIWSEKEYNSAWESTADAHYTSKPVIDAMYRFLGHMGFTGGRVLEPTVGSGNFLGLMPETMADQSQWFASEIDNITSLIAKHLYPDAQVKTATPFEQAEFPYGRFDLAIGNPPFGSLRIRESKEQRKDLDGWKIHNYVIGKSAMHLRPGGVMAMVVTHRFMDTMDDSSKQTREWLDQNMWFLGAVRLPNTAFKKNAGTEVVTDIVFFMRPDMSMIGKVTPVKNWTTMGSVTHQGKMVPVNQYFADNPHLMFGQPSMEGSMYGDKEEFTLKDTGVDIPAAFDQALQKDFAELSGVLNEVKSNQQDAPSFFMENREDIAIGGYILDGDTVYVREENDEYGNVNFKELTPDTQWTAKKTLGQSRYDRLKGLLQLRGKAYALVNAEQRDAPNIEALRKTLRQDYQAFVKVFGPINATENARLLESDPKIEFGLETNFRKAITPARAKKLGVSPRADHAEMADILLKRVYRPVKSATYAKDAIDGFSISLSERGKVDLAYITELTTSSLTDVVDALSTGESPRIFMDPATQEWTATDEYLSGNIKKKLKEAQDAGLTVNEQALQAVLPEDIAIDDIHIEMGAPWVPASVYSDFLRFLGVSNPDVTVTGNGQILFPEADIATMVSNEFNANLKNSDFTVAEMFVNLANKKALLAYDTYIDENGNKRQKVNVERTKVLQPLGKSIIEMFNNWVRADADRATALAKEYNEKINTSIDREFDGKLLRVADDSLMGANPSIKLRPNQKRAAWRMIVSDNVLMDHVVGAGKTISMIAGIMERRRMGLSKKPLIAVPNHLVGQWAKDFLALYPGARLLAASEKDFAPANRKKLMARMATGEYDAIIIGHSMLTKMPASPEMRTTFVDQEVEFLNQIREEMEAAGANKRAIAGINKRIDSLRQKLQASIDKDIKDQVVFFEETGIDYLTVDECFPYDTPVFTDQGLISIGDIVEKRLKVNVLCCNHNNKELEWKPIIRWIPVERKKALIRVDHEFGHFTCTVDHKIWTQRGFIEAQSLLQSDQLFVLQDAIYPDRPRKSSVQHLFDDYQAVRTMSATLSVSHGGESQRSETPVLLQSMRSHLEEQPTRKKGSIPSMDGRDSWSVIARQENAGDFGADEEKQSDAQSGIHRENASQKEGENFSSQGREFKDYAPTADTSRPIRVGNGVSDSDSSSMGEIYKSSELLQSRFSEPGIENSRRGGRQYSQAQEMEIFGSAKRIGFECTRLVRLEILESGSFRGNGTGSGDHSVVYDIEVADNHNFFAAGVLVSNCHEFKNLMYHTNMTPVVGMGNPKGSNKAFDLYMKTSSLQQRNGGITFATGTPISNSLVEMYAILRYLNPQGLEERGLQSFDAWLKTFAGIEEVTEYTATGQLKARNVLTSFSGVPELLQLYRKFADTVTMDDLKRLYAEAIRERNQITGETEREEFPVPKVANGGRQLITVPISPSQRMYVDYLSLRAKALEGMTGAERKEYATTDNPLWIYSDARKAALDIRVVDPTAMDEPDSKVNRAVDKIKRVYDKTAADKGTQLVFSDLSTPKKVADKEAKKFIKEALDVLDINHNASLPADVEAATTYREKWNLLSSAIQGNIEFANMANMDAYREKLENFMVNVSDEQLSAITTADTGFSVYDDIKEKLIQQGIPENEIAFIHDFNSKQEKQELFDRVNAGEVRVLLGSTQKMGAGTNVQERAVALHHLDAPWRPSDMEQREGRIIRQGNSLYLKNPDGFMVEIYAYSTENTFDAVMWQVLSRKAGALEQFRQGKRVVEEVNKDSASYADFMAETTGNPIFREKFELQRKVDELDSQHNRARMQTSSAREFLDRVKGRTDLETRRIQDAETTLAKLPKNSSELTITFENEAPFSFDLEGIVTDERNKYNEEVTKFHEDQSKWQEKIAEFNNFINQLPKTAQEELLKIYGNIKIDAFSFSVLKKTIEEKGISKDILEKLKEGAIPEIQEKGQTPKIELPKASEKPTKPIYPEVGSARVRKRAPELKVIREKLYALKNHDVLNVDINGISAEISRNDKGNKNQFNMEIDGRDIASYSNEDTILSYFYKSKIDAQIRYRIQDGKKNLERLGDEKIRSEVLLEKANLDEMADRLKSMRERYEEIVQQVNEAEAQIALDRKGQHNIYVERDTTRNLSEPEDTTNEAPADLIQEAKKSLAQLVNVTNGSRHVPQDVAESVLKEDYAKPFLDYIRFLYKNDSIDDIEKKANSIAYAAREELSDIAARMWANRAAKFIGNQEKLRFEIESGASIDVDSTVVSESITAPLTRLPNESAEEFTLRLRDAVKANQMPLQDYIDTMARLVVQGELPRGVMSIRMQSFLGDQWDWNEGTLEDALDRARESHVRDARIAQQSPGDPDISFSKTTQTPAQVGVSASRIIEKLIRPKAAIWHQAGMEVEVVKSFTDLPIDLKQALGNDPRVEGFYDAQSRKVYLIAGNLASEQRAQEVLDHETIGHWVSHNLRDAHEFSQLLNAIDRLEKVGNRKVLAAAKKVDQEQPGLNRQHRGEEIFATLLESGEYAKIQLVKTWADRVMDLIKKVMRRLMPNNVLAKGLTLHDVFRFARESRKRLESGEKSQAMWVFSGSGVTYRSYAGEKAKTADLSLLQQAKQRVESGENAETVRKETGWFKGKEGKWRFEIDDRDFSFNTEWIEQQRAEKEQKNQEYLENNLPTDDEISDFFDALAPEDAQFSQEEKEKRLDDQDYFLDSFKEKLGKVVTHPALFAAYPKLKDIDVSLKVGTLLRGDPAGFYTPSDNEISVKAYTYESAKKTLIHEIQHAVQAIEGFSPGGIANESADELEYAINKRRVDDALTRVKEKEFNALGNYYINIVDNAYERESEGEITLQEAKSIIKQADNILQELEKSDPFYRNDLKTAKEKVIQKKSSYLRLAGEIEARDAANRIRMTPEQRQATPPYRDTMFKDGIADEDVIVRMEGGTQYRLSFSLSSPPTQASEVLDDIGAGIPRVEEQKTILNRIKNYAELWSGTKDKVAAARPMWLKLLTRQQMVELLQDIPKIGESANAFEQSARDLDADKSELKQKAYEIAKEWEQWLNKARDKGLLLSKIMHYSTLEEVDPIKAPDRNNYGNDADWQYAMRVFTKLNGWMKDLEAHHPELAGMYEKARNHYQLMTEEHYQALEARIGRSAKGVFRALLERAREQSPVATPKTLAQKLSAIQARDNTAFDTLSSAIMERLANPKMKAAQTAVLRDRLTPEAQGVFDEVVKDVEFKVSRSLEALKELYETRVKKGPYFPLSRFGAFEVFAEKAGEKLPAYMRFENQKDQLWAIQKLQDEGWVVKSNYQIKQDIMNNPPSDSFLGRMFVAVDEEVTNPAEAMILKDELYQMYLNSLPELSIRKHFMHRKGVPGFSQDALRGFAHFMNSKSNAIARLRHSDKLTDALAEMKTAKNKMGNDPLVNAREQARAAMVINELNGSYDWLMNPSNATWANRLTSFGFLWYLTNISTALVNLTQVPLMTFPDLAARHGGMAALKMLTKGIGEYGGWKFSRGESRKKAYEKIQAEFGGDLGRALDRLEKSGIVSRTQSVTLAGMGEDALENRATAAGKVGAGYQFLLKHGAWMFHHAEVANREITAIAAYRLARNKMSKEGKTPAEAHDHAYQMAYNTVARTQGDYSNANRAPVMRSDMARVFLLFRSFSQMMTWRLARDAYQGMISKTASTKDRQEARSRLGWMVGASFLFGGAVGVPFYSAMVGIINAVAGGDPDDPWDVEDEAKQFLESILGTTGRQAVMTGAVGQLPKLLGLSGFDLSPRVTMDLARLWIREVPGDLEGEDAASWYIQQFLGPLAGMAISGARGYSDMRHSAHDPQAMLRGLESLAPAPLRNLGKAYRYATEGVTTKRGDLLVDDMDWSMVLSQAIGFTPDQVADQYARNTAKYELKDVLEKRRKNLLNRYVYSVENDDQEMTDETIAMIDRFNELNYEYPITANHLLSTYRNYQRARTQQENGVYLPSKGLRARLDREEDDNQEE